MAEQAEHRPGDPDHDVDTKVLWRVGIGLAAGTIVSGALMLGVFLWERSFLARHDPPPSPVAAKRAPRALPQEPGEMVAPRDASGPILQKDPVIDMQTLRAQEEAALTTYGWTDESAGLARVPVTRAMEIVAARGVAPLAPPPAEEEGAR